MRRFTPWATTTAVPTVPAVLATGEGPMTPARRMRRRAIPMSVSFRFVSVVGVIGVGRFIGLDGRQQGLDRDSAAGHELAARAADGRRERRRPFVLPHQ